MAKKVILHADDLGISSAVNRATFQALEKGWISSASVMVPTPRFAEVARFAKRTRNKYDLGVHLTFTSEWKKLKWSSCLPSREVRSLLDSKGHFHSTLDAFAKHAKIDEIESEAHAQIQMALKSGLKPSHLDCHMFALYWRNDLRALMKKLSSLYRLPFVLPTDSSSRIFFLTAETRSGEWAESYLDLFSALPEGVSEVVVHLGRDTTALRRQIGKKTPWGSAWRQRDFEWVASEFFHDFLKKKKIRLVSWKDRSASAIRAV